jgi:hypothetical protein
MKKLIVLGLVAAMVLGISGTALATQVASISTDLVPQSVQKTLPIKIKIHPTIAMDTFEKPPAPQPPDPKAKQKDEINIPCLNPKTNPHDGDGVEWYVWSNMPFYKTASWTDLKTKWEVSPGKIIEDTIPAGRVVVQVDGIGIPNPWTGPVLDPPDHMEVENVMVKVTIGWCDSAGIYTGSLTLDAHQN